MKNTNITFRDIRPGRRVGNTTRQVDIAIQWLFEGETVEIEDHYNQNKPFQQRLREADTRLLHLILDRLKNEHNIKKGNILMYYHPTLTLKLTI